MGLLAVAPAILALMTRESVLTVIYMQLALTGPKMK